MKLKPSSSESENQMFTQALRRILSVPHSEIVARIPAKHKRSEKRSGDSPSAKARAIGGASR